jgi:2-amino-4-hydroxy-6-hydroxymethyldihydropteridine diphosphokinase
MNEKVYILLGSNIGERIDFLSKAIELIGSIGGIDIVRTSAVYNSPAMEMSEPAPDFLNQAIEIMTSLSPLQLLSELKNIEIQMGRREKGNYKSRNIDLDILLYGQIVMENQDLTIPQKRLLNRPFAIIPLLEIAPHLVHPGTLKPLSDYVSDSDFGSVAPLEKNAACRR